MYNSQITSERIKQLAKNKNISLLLLNEQCGLSKDTIKTAGKSENGMKARNLYLIAECLGVSVDYLLGRTDEPNPPTYQNINSQNFVNVNSGDNLTINTTEQPDEMTAELIKIFKNLSFEDRIKIMNSAIEIKNKGL